MTEIIERSALALAGASNGSPITTTIVVLLFYLFFNLLEAMLEKLIYGERFEHWLDPIFITVFIAYSAYAVYACALHNSKAA